MKNFSTIFLRRLTRTQTCPGGFTLIEVMITVAILGILAAVAIPSYLGYIRRSYVNEAVSAIAGVKAAEEQYFSVNRCYTEAEPAPTAIPSGASVAWPTVLPVGWGAAALAVRPDARVRFQYQVYATCRWAATDSCDPPNSNAAAVDSALQNLGGGGCIPDGVGVGATALVNTGVFPTHWYVVVAQGDLDSDPTTNTVLVSAIDDSRIIRCWEGD